MAVEVQELLPAPPEQVFGLLSDVERTAGLGPEHERAEWCGPERGAGARFTGWNRRGDWAWDVDCLVTEYEPARRFAWSTNDPDRPSALWSYDLVAVDGGTLVTQRFRHGPGPTYLRQAVEEHPEAADRIVAQRARELEDGMRATLRAAAALLAP